MRFRDFLPPEAHLSVLNWALENEDRFRPSVVDEGVSAQDFRKSLVLNDLGPCKDILRAAIKPKLADFAHALGLSGYRLKGFDAELAAHNDGAFYRPHIDTGAPGTIRSTRLISAVYYFYNIPKGFSGGELRLFKLDQRGAHEDIEPENNMLAIFPAFCPHEVRPIACPSRSFSDSRFAINIWAHRAPS